ncbi:MAG: 2-oxoglutarate-acceptor oxidoreductase subunit OorD [Chloroflexi bacterium ADurb.Bin360]|nr:MAG: 2-oxoglutarate-acceptor oxidoreductase subunit OorD [Chloroflexi bacterium ADurb.Bin360]
MKAFARMPLNLQKMKVPRGIIYLIPERCKGCRLCLEFCPREVLQESTEINAKGYHFPEIAPGKDTNCIHCQFCTMICPEFAIFTEEIED